MIQIGNYFLEDLLALRDLLLDDTHVTMTLSISCTYLLLNALEVVEEDTGGFGWGDVNVDQTEDDYYVLRTSFKWLIKNRYSIKLDIVELEYLVYLLLEYYIRNYPYHVLSVCQDVLCHNAGNPSPRLKKCVYESVKPT